MAGKGGRRIPLVADRRYPSDGARSGGRQSGGGSSSGGGGKRPPSQQRRQTSRQPRRRGGLIGFVATIFRMTWGLVWGIGIRLAILGAFIVFAVSFYYYSTLPPIDTLVDARARGSVTLLDRKGEVFAWRGETFGGPITADTVSPNLLHAIVATEDKRFYSHFGVSPRGIVSAMSINLSEGRGPFEGNGGSTITQQLAKLLCLGAPYDPKVWKSESDYEDDCRSGGIKRKLKEVPYSFALEAKYGKEGVLTLYLNRAYLGAGARGFEAASQRYFGKSAVKLTPAEGAMLAGLLKAPSRYAPTNNLKLARERATLILGLMHDQGYLDDAQYEDALAHPAELSPMAAQRAGGYFADWVMDSGPDFLTKDTTEDVVIETTLDQSIQRSAEEAVNSVFDKKLKAGSKVETAVVVMSADGAVRAMVGGREPAAPGAFNRAVQARRQTGSTFKPFVYAAAIDLGDTMNSLVEDAPLCMNVPGSGEWCPKNYEPNYAGIVTYTDALAHSLNTATVRIAQRAGLDAVRQVANQFGLSSELAQGPALALGVSEATLIDMTGAYAGILNGGSSVKPYGLVDLRIRGDDAPLMDQAGGMGERVISENSALQLTYMMTQVIERGTGRRARLDGWQAAGKSGTTQSARDAWFIGFTADYVVGVWMGYDDNKPLTGVTGGGLPAEIWHEVMARIHSDVAPIPLRLITPDQIPAQAVPTAPTYPGEVFQSDGTQVPQQQPSTDQTITDILLGILGGN